MTPPRDAGARIAGAVLPLVALAAFGLFAGAAVLAASRAGTLGFDFLAYHQAANRVLAGERLYDPTVEQTGGFGLFYYPPPFVLAILPLAPLAGPAAAWVWTAFIVSAFALGVVLMPVRRSVKWATVLLAGLSWPLAYSIKLGQVGPLLFLLFAIGWRWLERPGALGTSAAVGALIKIQPGLILVWAALTRRWVAVVVGVVVAVAATGVATLVSGGVDTWIDYFAVIRNVSDPISTPHNFTPGAIAFQLGASPAIATIAQLTASLMVVAAVVVAARTAVAPASYLAAVIASQLLSPVLWDHYAMLLLLPTAWLLDRGQRWAIAIPLATSTLLIPVTPPAAYPLAFAAALVAVIVVGTSRARAERQVPVPEPA